MNTTEQQRVLHLTLKKKWFDMIASGEKKEEYREIKGYWAARLLYKIPMPIGGYLCAWRDIADGNFECEKWKAGTGGAPIFESFEYVYARNGYSKNSASWKRKVLGIEIGEGKPEWGAEPGKKYFVIKLGDLLNPSNTVNNK